MKFKYINKLLLLFLNLNFVKSIDSFICADGGCGNICNCNGDVYYGKKYLEQRVF